MGSGAQSLTRLPGGADWDGWGHGRVPDAPKASTLLLRVHSTPLFAWLTPPSIAPLLDPRI